MADADLRAKEPGRHDSNAVKSPVDARSGRKLGVMRYVLTISTLLAIVAMIIVYFAIF